MSEREVQHEPQVLEGEDEIPHQPADLASYTPGAPAAHRARVALWAALVVVVGVAAAILVWALVT